jgi:hypothetical protein
MLLSKQLKIGDVVSIKLLTGEEVIARYEGEEDDSIILSKAATLAANPQGGLGIIPWMMSANPEKLYINTNAIIAKAPTDKELADTYIASTTNIQIAT